MAQEIIMPKAGITVESCLMGAWRKNPGDSVAEDEVLFDYETDKAAFECVSTASGVLLHRFYESGDEVPTLVPVAIVGEPGEDISALLEPSEREAHAPEAVFDAGALKDTEPEREARGGFEKASPRARGLAAAQGIELSRVIPSGPDGRILEADVIRAAGGVFGSSGGGNTALSDEPMVASKPASEYTDEAFTKIRALIANTMTASLGSGAQLTHHHSFDAGAVLALREDFKRCEERYGYRDVSVGDIILYVTARVLAKHPEINALVTDHGVRKYHTVNLGVAVDTIRGLMVPTVFGAEKKSLRELSRDVKALAAAARGGSISPDALTGGTFTVSNLGATGVEVFTPIINPPQAAIIGVCGVTERVRRGQYGKIETYPAIGISLTYDHRAIDGAPASRFAKELCEALEAFSWKTFMLEEE